MATYTEAELQTVKRAITVMGPKRTAEFIGEKVTQAQWTALLGLIETKRVELINQTFDGRAAQVELDRQAALQAVDQEPQSLSMK